MHQARKRLAKVAEEKIERLYEGGNITNKEYAFLNRYFSLQRLIYEISSSNLKKMSTLESARLKVFKAQRGELLIMWEKKEIDDRLFRQLEHELDSRNHTAPVQNSNIRMVAFQDEGGVRSHCEGVSFDLRGVPLIDNVFRRR